MRWIGLGIGLLTLLLVLLFGDVQPRPVVQLRTVAGAIDRCPTCHRAVLEREGATSGRPGHPPIAGHAALERIGCTPCHGGQGRRLDAAAHGPPLGGGPAPFLRPPLIQAYCARCHLPGALVGAERLERGMQQYLGAGCSGCHQPGRRDAARGPDLRRMGRRSPQELRAAIVEVRVDRGPAAMPSYAARYPATAAGRQALDDLLTALVALQVDPAPYRAAWRKPGLDPEQDCLSCHSDPSGARATGPAHRCPLLVRRASLRCRRCHGQRATGAWNDHRRCPQLRAVFPLCPVCHLRAP